MVEIRLLEENAERETEALRSKVIENMGLTPEQRQHVEQVYKFEQRDHGIKYLQDLEPQMINKAVASTFALPNGRTVKDSGERRVFSTGAQRDAGAGKGFFDCIPTGPLIRVANFGLLPKIELDFPRGAMITRILRWKDGDREEDHLAKACFLAFHQMAPSKEDYWGGIAYDGLLRLAQLYEAGARKYSKNNWQKGMPKSVFLNSLLRHAFKVGNNLDDEDHLAAVIFNAFCLMHFEDLDWKAPDGTDLNDD